MELTLNVAWAVLAIVSLCLHSRFCMREGADKRTHAIALVLILLILFPVISVTDDLQLANLPAETDAYSAYARRDHAQPSLHTFTPTATLPSYFPIEFLYSPQPARMQGAVSEMRVSSPALGSIQNRPPPTA